MPENNNSSTEDQKSFGPSEEIADGKGEVPVNPPAPASHPEVSASPDENSQVSLPVQSVRNAEESNIVRHEHRRSHANTAGSVPAPIASKSAWKEILEWINCIVIAVLIALVLRSYVFQVVTVQGPSMQDTLYTGEKLIVWRFSYWNDIPKRGDILITHFPDSTDTFVKRAIALPGETIEIKDGYVYIDGQKLIEPYLDQQTLGDMDPYIVPSNMVFVMGDNRGDSRDSRMVGSISINLIVGKAACVVWPLDKIALLDHGQSSLE